jgi:hypothetical protein
LARNFSFCGPIEVDFEPASDGSPDGVVSNQQDHRSDHSDQQAVQVPSVNPGSAEDVEEPASSDSADDPRKDIEDPALALFIDNLAPDETSEQTEHNSRKK